VNIKKAACVFLSRVQTAGQSRNIKMANKFFEKYDEVQLLGKH